MLSCCDLTDLPLQVFTLGNLTHLVYDMKYDPLDLDEGVAGIHLNDDDDDDDDSLIPPRVRVERLHDLLRRCPNLEASRGCLVAGRSKGS